MSILNINTINTTKSTLLRQQGNHQLGTNQEHQPQKCNHTSIKKGSTIHSQTTNTRPPINYNPSERRRWNTNFPQQTK